MLSKERHQTATGPALWGLALQRALCRARGPPSKTHVQPWRDLCLQATAHFGQWIRGAPECLHVEGRCANQKDWCGTDRAQEGFWEIDLQEIWRFPEGCKCVCRNNTEGLIAISSEHLRDSQMNWVIVKNKLLRSHIFCGKYHVWIFKNAAFGRFFCAF